MEIAVGVSHWWAAMFYRRTEPVLNSDGEAFVAFLRERGTSTAATVADDLCSQRYTQEVQDHLPSLIAAWRKSRDRNT